MTELEQFLTKNVEGYLFGDLASMKGIVVEGDGACGYPMLMTAFAGIELFGALLSEDEFDTDSGLEYFRSFWQRHLYTQPPRQKYADPLYEIARHGLAHGFALWGPVHVMKDDCSWHLREDSGGAIYVSAATLADDVVRAYQAVRGKLIQEPSVTTRFEEMTKRHKGASVKHLKSVRKHALPPIPSAQPVSMPSGTSQQIANQINTSNPVTPGGGFKF